ncbi:MAG: hypothetical protein ACOX9C_02750 [Kiritimatiellia bacterium]|jgi:hypothetical protein
MLVREAAVRNLEHPRFGVLQGEVEADERAGFTEAADFVANLLHVGGVNRARSRLEAHPIHADDLDADAHRDLFGGVRGIVPQRAEIARRRGGLRRVGVFRFGAPPAEQRQPSQDRCAKWKFQAVVVG